MKDTQVSSILYPPKDYQQGVHKSTRSKRRSTGVVPVPPQMLQLIFEKCRDILDSQNIKPDALSGLGRSFIYQMFLMRYLKLARSKFSWSPN